LRLSFLRVLKKKKDIATITRPKSPLKTVTVSCVIAPGPAPGEVIDGVAWLDRKSGDICVYGGLKLNGKVCGDLHTLSSESFHWTVHQNSLKACAGHIVFCFADEVFFYGGGLDLCYLTEKNELVSVRSASSEILEPRSYMTASIWKNQAAIIIFGGRSQNGSLFDDVWRLELFSAKEEQKRDQLAAKWHKLKTPDSLGYCPSARERHATVILNDEMFLFGGIGIGGASGLAPPNALEILDLNTGAWQLRDTAGEQPASLPGILAHPIGSSAICLVEATGEGIFNDLSILRFEVGLQPTWSKLKLDWQSDWTMIPGQRRYQFSCCDESGSSLFIFGGITSSNFFSDSIILIDLSELHPSSSSFS